ncbi:hypothetical protein [Sulfuricurvum sp.]|uniref:hypothetical protein n=1 Tax=Sulfuricurvum sp. TaxID=2025608 RepID=UPI002614AC9F|nr:hypothetical protein [Sulfuricurvum sp.]MDD2267668.1 hypothetical protein [Sulfuricurvum sp.]MDD2784243.1 hypothetical protein [Sulfuricurvum sp.]
MEDIYVMICAITGFAIYDIGKYFFQKLRRRWGENPKNLFNVFIHWVFKNWLPIFMVIGLMGIFSMLGKLIGLAFVQILKG